MSKCSAVLLARFSALGATIDSVAFPTASLMPLLIPSLIAFLIRLPNNPISFLLSYRADHFRNIHGNMVTISSVSVSHTYIISLFAEKHKSFADYLGIKKPKRPLFAFLDIVAEKPNSQIESKSETKQKAHSYENTFE